MRIFESKGWATLLTPMQHFSIVKRNICAEFLSNSQANAQFLLSQNLYENEINSNKLKILF